MDTRKLLFVDDEPDLLVIVEQQFEGKIFEFNVEVIFAENGVEAIKKLEEHPEIEVVLSDINMPIMDGLEFLGRANKLDRLLKIVMVSAYSDMTNIRKAMNRGAYDFITKPIDFEDLQETIARVLRNVDQIKLEAAELNRLKKIEKEMEMARKIQSSILPSSFTPFIQSTSFEIFGTMIPARIVGGNFYDFFPIGPDKLVVTIGETAEKGMPAALYISSAREAIRGFASSNQPIPECLKEINNYLFYQKRDDVPNMTLGLFFGIFDINLGKLEYCIVNLPSPLLISKDGEIKELSSEKATALGASLESTYTAKQLTLTKDDCLALFTNGIITAKNKNNEIYANKLQDLLNSNHALPLQGLIDKVILDVRTFIAPAEQVEDYVILCLKYKG